MWHCAPRKVFLDMLLAHDNVILTARKNFKPVGAILEDAKIRNNVHNNYIM